MGLIEFSERELKALPVPEYSFCCFLASLAGRVLIGLQHVPARCVCTEESEATLFV